MRTLSHIMCGIGGCDWLIATAVIERLFQIVIFIMRMEARSPVILIIEM